MKDNDFLKTIMLIQHLDKESKDKMASTIAAWYNIDENVLRNVLFDLNHYSMDEIMNRISKRGKENLAGEIINSGEPEKAIKLKIQKLQNTIKKAPTSSIKRNIKEHINRLKKELIYLKNIEKSKNILVKSTPTLIKKIVDFYDYYTKTILLGNNSYCKIPIEIKIVLCWEVSSVEFVYNHAKNKFSSTNISSCEEYRMLKHEPGSDCHAEQELEALKYTTPDYNFELGENNCFNEFKLREQFIIDPLGIYISSSKNISERECKIVLFCDKIVRGSVNKSFDYKALFEVVMAHEFAHAYHHLGIDENNQFNKLFYYMSTNVVEGYANYMTDLYIQNAFHSPNNKKGKLHDAFLNGTSQRGAYSIYKGFKFREYSVKNLNTVNGFYRNEKNGKNFYEGAVGLSQYDANLDEMKCRQS